MFKLFTLILLYCPPFSIIHFPVIQPTYTCFEDSFKYFENMVRNHRKYLTRKDISLVHGVCLDIHRQYGTTKYIHSWVEVRDPRLQQIVCVNGVLVDGKLRYEIIPRKAFYDYYSVIKTQHYSPYDVREKIKAEKYIGAWDIVKENRTQRKTIKIFSKAA